MPLCASLRKHDLSGWQSFGGFFAAIAKWLPSDTIEVIAKRGHHSSPSVTWDPSTERKPLSLICVYFCLPWSVFSQKKCRIHTSLYSSTFQMTGFVCLSPPEVTRDFSWVLFWSPVVATGSYFWLASSCLSPEFACFMRWQGVPRSTCTFPASDLDSTFSFFFSMKAFRASRWLSLGVSECLSLCLPSIHFTFF